MTAQTLPLFPAVKESLPVQAVKKSFTTRIEIFSGPDRLGRYGHFLFWHEPDPCYCLTCGADPSRGCACYGRRTERGQVFNVPLPEWAKGKWVRA